MCYSGMAPNDAKKILKFLDKAFGVVQGDARGILQEAIQRYRSHRSANTKVGFEELISAELFRVLTKMLQNKALAFYQFPGIKSDTIDLFVEHKNGNVYIENKMYYSTSCHDYEKDRKKLIAVAGEPQTLCVWTHFQYHKNQKNPHLKLFTEYKKNLKAENFKTSLRVFGKPPSPYLIRLAFWEPYRKVRAQQSS